MVDVVGDDPGVGAVAGAAHGHVGELAAAAVFEAVGDVDGGALSAVDGDGVAVGQVLTVDLFAREADEAAVVGEDDECLGFGTDVDNGAAFEVVRFSVQNASFHARMMLRSSVEAMPGTAIGVRI